MDNGRSEHDQRHAGRTEEPAHNDYSGNGGNGGNGVKRDTSTAGAAADLRRMLAGTQAAERLYRALALASSAGTIATHTRHSQLLESIVQAAAQVISARAAALFLLDRESGELVFEVALGGKADEVKKFRVPMGHGIAGLVAATGQPMAVSDAEQDERRAADIADAVNYVPHTILCVPLYYNGEVIGVLELLDKEGGLPFSGSDIELLGLFASQASSAIELSRVNTDLDSLVLHLVQTHGEPEDGAAAIADMINERAETRRSLELATMIQQICEHGEEGVALCRTILSGLLTYLGGRPDTPAGRA